MRIGLSIFRRLILCVLALGLAAIAVTPILVRVPEIPEFLLDLLLLSISWVFALVWTLFYCFGRWIQVTRTKHAWVHAIPLYSAALGCILELAWMGLTNTALMPTAISKIVPRDLISYFASESIIVGSASLLWTQALSKPFAWMKKQYKKREAGSRKPTKALNEQPPVRSFEEANFGDKTTTRFPLRSEASNVHSLAERRARSA
jgi:signal transduction histidine kinase